MTAHNPPAHRHPAYLAGAERCKNPVGPGRGNPYPFGSDDYAMWRMGFEDALILMRAKGETEIEDVDDDDTDVCDHDDYEIDLVNGRSRCNACRYTWSASEGQITFYIRTHT